MAPAPPNAPLLLLPTSAGLKVVTTSVLQSSFSVLIQNIGLDSGRYSLHSLRRGGATTCYHLGAEFTQIQKHGGWRSQAFWAYIVNSTLKSDIPSLFTKSVST